MPLSPIHPLHVYCVQGLLDIGKLQPGETLVVSGAAGATGSIVCQIGKQKGAKVYAIAGSQEKCDWLEKELGVDKALNYKSPTFFNDYKKHVGYFDVYFDNVGGEILDFSLTRMKKNARVVLCGGCGQYMGMVSGLMIVSQVASLIIVNEFKCRKRDQLLMQSSTDGKPKGLAGYLNLISQRAKMEGFIMYVRLNRLLCVIC